MRAQDYTNLNIERGIAAVNKYLSTGQKWKYNQLSAKHHSWLSRSGNVISIIVDPAQTNTIVFSTPQKLNISSSKIASILSTPAFKRYFELTTTSAETSISTSFSNRQLSDRHLGEYLIHLLRHMSPMIEACSSKQKHLEAA